MYKFRIWHFLVIIAPLALIALISLNGGRENGVDREAVAPALLQAVPEAKIRSSDIPIEYPSEFEYQPEASPSPAARKKARIAIVIDDLGMDRRNSERALVLPPGVTLAVLPYAPTARDFVQMALANGHEVILHVPMEPEGQRDTGPNVLLTSLSDAEFLRRLRWNLDRATGYAGINNHMGSRLTSDARAMTLLFEELSKYDLYFLDSRTSSHTLAAKFALNVGVPAVERDIFLDNEREPALIAAQLAKLVDIAQRHGTALGIGHPYPETLDTLREWINSLDHHGVELVPASRLAEQAAWKSVKLN